MSLRKFYLLVATLICSGIHSSFSQAGVFDSTFGTNGIAIYPDGGGNSVAIQSDGKIVSGGGFGPHFGIVRFNPDGSIDNSFGINGAVEAVMGIGYNGDEDIVLQPDGKILEAGSCVDNTGIYVFALARFNSDGSLDNSFGDGGKVLTHMNDVYNNSYGKGLAIQPDGKIIQVGYSSNNLAIEGFAIARFNPDGSLDNSFGTLGKIITPIGSEVARARCAAVQSDGKILVFGESDGGSQLGSFSIIRYNNDGTLDNSFSGDGKDTICFTNLETTIIGEAMTIQSDGKIIVSGFASIAMPPITVIPIIRYLPDGTLDESFGDHGRVIFIGDTLGYHPQSMSLQADGKILIGGQAGYGVNPPLMIARFNTNGAIDSTFGDNGFFIRTIEWPDYGAMGMALQNDGKIVTAGTSGLGWTITRVLSGLNVGVLDLTTGDLPLLFYPNPVVSQATLQYTLSQSEYLSITLFNLQGDKVHTFIDNEGRLSGNHSEELYFNTSLPGGDYFLLISNGVGSQTIKIKVLDHK